MEMLIFLNGALLALNVMLLLRLHKKPTANAPMKEAKKEDAAAEQWSNLMSYDGSAQGGVKTDED